MRPLLVGYANAITTARAAIGVVIAVPILTSLGERAPVWVVAAAVAALILDGVDGYVARRTNSVSAFGARYDIEVDSALALLLCVAAAALVGWWVMVIGAARYLWLIAIRFDPRLGTPVAPAYWRKVVGMAQPVALLLVISGLVPDPATAPILLVAIAGLVVSFGTQAVEAIRRSCSAIGVVEGVSPEG